MANEITGVNAPYLGSLSGRLQPSGWTPTDGSWALCLGADRDDFVIDTWPAHRLGINGVYPTSFAGSETLQIAVDRGSTQTITFQSADQTLEQVIDRINATLTGATASSFESELMIETESRGLESQLEVVGGTGMVTLGHLAETGVGHGGLKIGDWLGFKRLIDLTSITLLIIACKFRQPENTDIVFRFVVEVDDQAKFEIQPEPGSTVDFSTRRINVSGITGSKNVMFMIQAVAA